MKFTEALYRITGQKENRLKRARDWMKLYIAEDLANKKSLEDWYNKEGDMDETAVEFHRDFFRRWKPGYISRKASESRAARTAKERLSKRETHKRTGEEQRKLLRDVADKLGREGAKIVLEDLKHAVNVSDEQAKEIKKKKHKSSTLKAGRTSKIK